MPAADPAQQPQLDTLKSRADFQRLTRHGRKKAMRGFVLQVAPKPAQALATCPHARIGYTASKKVGNAVARNRAKRRLRGLVHEVLRPVAKPSLDYVLVGRHTTLTRPWPKLKSDLKSALAQLDAEMDMS